MNQPSVAVVGSGPAIDAVRAALDDTEATASECDPERVGATDLAVVAGAVGDERFESAHAAADESDTPWVAVELGGVGGRELPDVTAGVSGFAPTRACWQCLCTRVEANADDRDADAADSGGEIDRATARFAGAIAGREAATLVSGGESTILGGVVEVPHARRSVLPVPNCECDADGRTRSLSRTDEQRSLEDAVARAERTADDRVGIVSSVGEAESFPAPYYLAELADTTGFSDAQAAEQAAGVAGDWNRAFMKALGEALERYSAGVYRASAFRVARPSELDAAVAPDAFVRPEERSDAPADDAELGWIRGENLRTDDPAHLPAEFVHFPPPAARHKPSITTGLGLGNSTVEALLAGLYEVIERDAAMLSWYSTFEPLGLSVASERFDRLAARARSMGLRVTPLLVTQDVDVPVVAVAVHRAGDWPRFALGSDADLDADAAAAAALAEALQNWMELRSMGPEEAADADGAIGDYAEFPESARALVAPETTVPTDSVGPPAPPTGRAELSAVLDRLADAGLSAYAARLTPRDVERLGFEAVRVLVPAAQPLFTDDPFFGERAREVPGGLGFEFRPDRDHHPYP